MPTHQSLIVVTRPEPGLSETMTAFEQAGFPTVACPLLALHGPEQPEQARQQLRHVATWDTLIFPSQHAVEQAFKLLPDWAIAPATQLLAVGQRTAHRLCDHLPENSENPLLVSKKANSEGVIDILAGLQHPGQVAIITAPGGRQAIQHWLTHQLQQNPARVSKWTEVFVYRRQHVVPPTDCIQTINRVMAAGQTVFTLATSIGILTALLESWPAESLPELQRQPLICASSRIATAATDAGFRHCLIANGAAADQLVQAAQSALVSSS